MIDLSPATERRIDALFLNEDIAEAKHLVSHECAEALFFPDATPVGLERVRFAAIRSSGGDLGRLREAIKLAATDWRDLLVAVDFANDVRAHQKWQPRRFDPTVAAKWQAGQLVEGVALGPNAAVEIASGVDRGRPGITKELLGLEPVPRYRVQLGDEQVVDFYQWHLQLIR